MDLSLMNDNELMISHLFVHTSYGYSNPKFGRNGIEQFHSKIVDEMEKRKKSHQKVDFLDKVYKG